MKLPTTAEGWREADEHMRQAVVPRVLHELDVNVMNHVLSLGIYSYFTTKYGTEKTNQHRQHPNKAQKLRNDMTEVLTEKKAAKKRLRQLRKTGTDPEAVRHLACEFHSLVRAHSRLNRTVKKQERVESQKQQRKECRKDLHKFAKKILNDDNYTSIEPTFTASEAEAYFDQVSSTTPATFTRPSWMPESPSPSVQLDISAFSEEEVLQIIARLNTSSCPSPTDQIPYLVLKKCPSLLSALLHIFNTCWSVKEVPLAWKVGVLRLLGKKKAEEDPSNPKNFRPIALTSCIGKVFTSLLKDCWMAYMRSNSYLNTSVQKAFIDGVPGCTEHHLKLLSMLKEARRKHRSLCVCWLDLANAFGSVHHSLIRYSFEHYHAPPEMVDMITSLYRDLVGVITTKTWQSAPIHLQLGVFQGDPLSVLVFNTVMNTMVDTITKEHSALGYRSDASRSRTNLLQYADDTSLLADGPSSCQTLLTVIEAWLSWSGMKANMPKCVCLAIQASTAKPYDPKLTLDGQQIPFIGDTTFHFLGAPVNISGTNTPREDLCEKLTTLLQKVDATLLSRQQKLLLYKMAIIPRLTWDLSISDLPISWLQNTLQPIATRFLKRWSGPARSADPNRLFLPKSNGGLELSHIVTTYKKIHAAKAGSFMCSRDSVVRAIATQDTPQEASRKRSVFRPHQEVVEVMSEDPGATKKRVVDRVKAKIQAEDTSSRLAHTTSLQVQGLTVREFEGRAAQNWSTVIHSLPEWHFKFALNAVTDSLPHNANLYKWKKLSSPMRQLCGEYQSLAHILNSCQKALELRRYNTRHDDVLSVIFKFAKNHMLPEFQITADLPGTYSFPQDIAATDQRPDIVLWSSKAVYLMELSVPFETNMAAATARKALRYEDLRLACSRTHHTTVITLEVGSRGYLGMEGLQELYQLLRPKAKDRRAFEVDIIRHVIAASYDIWCKRNWL